MWSTQQTHALAILSMQSALHAAATASCSGFEGTFPRQLVCQAAERLKVQQRIHLSAVGKRGEGASDYGVSMESEGSRMARHQRRALGLPARDTTAHAGEARGHECASIYNYCARAARQVWRDHGVCEKVGCQPCVCEFGVRGRRAKARHQDCEDAAERGEWCHVSCVP